MEVPDRDPATRHFEIPALILSAALGLYLCRTVSDALLGKQTGSVGAAVRQCGQILLWWALPLIARPL